MFAVLEKQTAGSFEGQVDIDVRPLEAALTQEKLSLLAAFIAALPLQTDPAQGEAFWCHTCLLACLMQSGGNLPGMGCN
jgi:hypothetical protein